INRWLFHNDIKLPGFLTAMLVGIILTNLADRSGKPLPGGAFDKVGEISLQLFLAMSLMSMDLTSLADSFGPIFVVLMIQIVVITLFAVVVIFRVMGGDYDAAVISGGFCGLGMGATPVAIANMSAVTRKYGPSFKAFLVIPLVGAFFIDLMNALVIKFFIGLPFFQHAPLPGGAVVYHEANQTEIHIADQDPRAMSDLRAVPGWQLNLATQNTECDFQRLCERSPVGMCVLQDDRIRYANPAAASLLARHGVEWERESFLEALHPDDRDIFEDKIEQLADAESIGPAPIRCVHPDGTSADILIHASSLQYNDRPAVLMTLEDVPASRSGHSAIDDRLRCERLLADLSARFVNVPVEQIEPLIDDSLKQLVEFLGNDRSTLFEFCEDEQFIDVTHSFSVPGCDTFPLGLFPVDRLPWYIGQFRQGDEVFLRNVLEDLPPEARKERDHCVADGIRSNVAVPLCVGGSVLGGITFAFLKHDCAWPEEFIRRLHLIGEVFANAIMRRRYAESLRTAQAENERLLQRLEQENRYLREQVVLRYQHDRIIGRSKAIARVLSDAEQVAATDAPVLLFGETGTGKELIAETIHDLSGRNRKPMVIVNCASLPATLVESELFGREAGAYTGAASAQVGRFTVADGSTLFLDEVGEFPIELQAKLLRVLENGRFERLGSPKSVTVDVRIVAATNRDLNQAVRDGTFRADLYHRLNVFPIHVPPLRERRDDIPELVWGFVESLGRRMGKSIKSIPREAMEQLQVYSWPGNVRELRNVVERAMILTRTDTLHVELPPEIQEQQSASTGLREREREQILSVLQETAWRIRGAGGASEILGIKPTTLEARMARLGIQRPRKRSKNSENH
ncbi:Formate hydrogenlyase transcriptional activator FhlA, partial [Durusdinium trenchii]